jgi:hypothetical protein
MKGKKEIAILFFIMAVLVFYIKSEKGDKTTYKLPVITKIETGDISRLTISKIDSEIVLLKENSTWLVGTQKYPADPSTIDKMLTQISGISLTALASESRNYSIYELDNDKKIEVKAFKGDNIIRNISIGKPASSYKHTFVMIDDDHRVFHAEGNLRADFIRTVPELRDKKVMSVQDEITELILNVGNKNMTIVKAAAPVSVDINEQKTGDQPVDQGPKWITADNRPVKDSEIDSIIRSLSDYRCDEFIEEKTKQDFTSPVYTATLKGTKEYSISFYEKQDEKYPAVTTESEYPFMVSEWKANQIMKELDSLLEADQ